ncbi:hypothetical protein I532_03975 [Brevibacillus borstelensis AK1]|uniref:Uncharacterized protein n=1 Tax=Brevibacillus borstelensis AK1 TaxID=1300222 RepID=M8DM78_9BACL|nr:hypothetical protein [Brevibacillus borstelensis]EMT54733.1 hypothetical protein I532_03975 [Brevibacillus borstelensis AK1]
MRVTKKSLYCCISYRALEVKNSGILAKLAEKCEREGTTPEIVKVFAALDWFVDEFPIGGYGKFPKSRPVAWYEKLLAELDEAIEKAYAILAEQPESRTEVM